MNTAQSVSSVADLRALPTPDQTTEAQLIFTENYHADAKGGSNQYTWDAANTDDDNGGTVIKLDGNQGNSPGRYLSAGYGGDSHDCSQFGANPAKDGLTNQTAIQNAHDALLIFDGDPNTATESHRQPRRGKLHLPAGTYPLAGKLFFYGGGVVVTGDGRQSTVLMLDPNVYTDTSHPTYVIDFELSNSMYVSQNNHFGSAFIGIRVVCGSDLGNLGTSGLFLSGAQGTYLDDVGIDSFGVEGIRFTGEHIGKIWVTSQSNAIGAGVVIDTVRGMTGESISVEHLRYGAPIGTDGEPTPYVLISNSSGVVIDSVIGESSLQPTSPGNGETFLRINNSSNVSINHVATNQFRDVPNGGQKANVVRITGDSGNNHIETIRNFGSEPANLINDTSGIGGNAVVNYQLSGADGFTSYHQSSYYNTLATGSLATGSLATGSLAVSGQPVVTEAFLFPTTQGRWRLRMNASFSNQYIICTPEYLCRIQHSDGKEIAFLFSLNHPYQGDAQPVVQVVKGSGLLVTATRLSSFDPMTPQVDFSVVQPDAEFGGHVSMTVTALGNLPMAATFTWSAVAEPDNTPITNGTATGTLAAPNFASEIIMVKPADTSRSAHTQADLDPDLSVAIGAGTYEFEGDVWVSAGSSDSFTNSVKFGIYGWTASSANFLAQIQSGTSGGSSPAAPIMYDCSAGSVTLYEAVESTGAHLARLHVFGQVVSTVAGQIGIGWGQKYSYATPYTMRAGSRLRVKQIVA